MKTLLSTILLFLALCADAAGIKDVRYEQKDIDNFNEIMAYIDGDRTLPMAELAIKVAKHLAGTPYVSRTIELVPEQLTINTRQTDCILFVEMVLALSLTAKEDNPSFEEFVNNIRRLRYRNGLVSGYASRLHYTSEWIIQGESSKFLREITAELGGVSLDQKFNFMTTHSDLYQQLKDNPAETERMRHVEGTLESHRYSYIPKPELPNAVQGIRNGDIICFNSNVPGLDIAHVAFAYWENGQLSFIHASSTEKKVVINKVPLIEYTNGIKGHNGIRVLRLED